MQLYHSGRVVYLLIQTFSCLNATQMWPTFQSVANPSAAQGCQVIPHCLTLPYLVAGG